MPGIVISEAFAEAFDRFRQSLLNDGKSARTVESYCSDIEKFLLHFAGQDRNSLADLTRADVTRFIAGLSGCGFKPATVNKAVNSLSCFERFLKDSGILPESARLVGIGQGTVLEGVNRKFCAKKGSTGGYLPPIEP